MIKSTAIPSGSTPGPSVTKRKKHEDDESNGSVSKKQRTRVSFSCGECHRRKQKCDRQTPCSHCVARKVPELCKAYTPGKSDQDLNARLTRLEQIIELALPQYANPETTPRSPMFESTVSDQRRRPSATPEDDNQSQVEDEDQLGGGGGTFQSGKWYGHTVSGSVAPAAVIEQLEDVDPSLKESLHDFPNGFRLHGRSILDTVRQDSEQSEAWKSLVQECGVSPHKISELLQELPPQRLSDVLIDYYFASVNWTRYPVSERDFRAAYTSINVNGVGVNPTDIRFLPLLFVVLAIAVRLAPESIGGDSRTRRITSLRYYWSSRRSLLIAAAIQPDSLDVVLTRLLSARFLTFDRRITECWSQLGAAVRTAQALGLHRDGSTIRGMDPSQVEYRRRIWAYLYHADRSYAHVLGRPNAIQDDYTSTLPPSNIEDEHPSIMMRTPDNLSNPTPMTFVILRHQLATIIGRMVHHFQQVRTGSHYSEVLALDADLLKFVDRLPPHFSLRPDTSLDESRKYIPVHRFLLITEVLFVRIGLHRPYLLRRLGTDRYLRSRNACFDSALMDHDVRRAFRASRPKESRDSLSNAYREFQTAMISGIYLVLNPRGKEANAMYDILDAFMKDHEGVWEMDETTRREIKIIEFLKQKASQVESRSESLSTQSGSTNVNNRSEGDVPADAHLLLGLQQSSGRQSTKPNFAPLVTNSATSPPRTPQMSYSSTRVPTSPSLYRLQQSGHAEELAHSPAHSASPSTEDESAQSLLDHWCNTVSNGPFVDGTSGMVWGSSNGSDFMAWPPPPMVVGGNPPLVSGLNTDDWNYWETLVNQIQRVP